MVVLGGIALSGVDGVDLPVAGAAPRETPAHKITRLRAKATRVQAAIDRMHARVESLVEDDNEVREALARTRAEQARTRRQVVEARRRLRAAKRLPGRRMWTIYTGGAPSTLGQLLGADSVHDALVTTKYRGRWSGPNARSGRGPGWPPSAARSSPAWPPSAVTSSTLGRKLRRAVIEERRRQERLRRQALLRRLAAERAARARAARSSMSWASSDGAGAPSGAAARAVSFARAQLGKPYLWGASGPSSFDCSGLTMAAYRSAGVWLPRVSRAQWGAGPHVGLGGLAPGDLVFFAHSTGNPGTIHHVGMYIGGGAMIEAPYSGARVRVASIGRRDYIGAVRPTG